MNSDASKCDEKGALLFAYAHATRAHTQAVADLTRAVGAMSTTDYELLKRKATQARELAEHCRLQLKAHIQAHCC